MSLRLTALALLWLPWSASSATRHTVVIANNQGFADEPTLRFAESDAEKIARTLLELRAATPPETRVLTGGNLARLRRWLHQALASVREDDEVVLFLSGHAGAGGLHYGADLWSWGELKALLDALPARRAIAFVDTCHSGALVTAKGLTLGPPLAVRVQTTLAGRWLISSSGANELSYESKRLAGSPFVHSLLTGLRGAADANADRRVSVDELYAFAHRQTLAQSLKEGLVQTPTRSARLRGTGEWTLVELTAGLTQVHLEGARLGQCYLLDRDERQVLAEVWPGQGVHLAPGTYRAKCVAEEAVRAASFELRAGQAPVPLDGLAFSEVERQPALARGPSAPLHHRLWARGGSNVLALGGPSLEVGVGYGLLRAGLAVDLQLLRSFAGLYSGLVSIGSPLPWWRAGTSELELGLHAGGSAGPARYVLLGQHSQLWLPLGGPWRGLARLEIGTRFRLAESVGPEPMLGFALGLAAQFP